MRSETPSSTSAPAAAALAGLAITVLLACVGDQTSGSGQGEPPPTSTAEPLVHHEIEDQLYALGYADDTDETDSETEGVIRNSSRAAPGLNLYLAGNRSPIQLIDNLGQEVHRWEPPADGSLRLIMAKLLEDGDLLVVSPRTLRRFTWHGALEWEAPVRPHHDVVLDNRGRILVLSKRFELIEHKGENLPVLVHDITTLSDEGAVLEKLPLFEIYRDHVFESDYEALIDATRAELEKLGLEELKPGETVPDSIAMLAGAGEPGDLLHTNSLFVMPHDVPGLCRRDSILVSVRNLDRISCIDRESGREVWFWGPGEIERQHHATLTPDDTILLFDNGRRRQSSRVIELDSRNKQIVWQYEAPGFFSGSLGAVTRMPNGNRLIVEGRSGRAFEVTLQGEIVWEFVAPLNIGGKRRRRTIYRFDRYPPEFFASFAPELGQRATSLR